MADDEREARPQSARSIATAPQPADIYVGSRVKIRRLEIGYSAQRLGEAIGFSRQQLEKVERGENRLTVGRLWDVCEALETKPGYFFDGFPGEKNLMDPSAETASLLVLPQAPDLLRLWREMSTDQRKAVLSTMAAFVTANLTIAEKTRDAAPEVASTK